MHVESAAYVYVYVLWYLMINILWREILADQNLCALVAYNLLAKMLHGLMQ